jgi:phage/plasmid-like protein (TIGR03299 family)
MAHQLTVTNGKAEMFYTGAKPWHELGTEVPSALTSAEAIKAAGLDWKVTRVPALYSTGGPDATIKEVANKYVNIREDNKYPLGIVGPDYTIVQNNDVFKFFDAVVGEKAAMYHTAGSLFGGKKLWLLAKLLQDTIVKGVDISKNFLLLTNSHDGSSNLKVLWSSVRVVCNNTLTSALQGADGKISKLRHTASIGNRVSEVQEFLGLTTGLINRFNLKANELASKSFSSALVTDFFERMGLAVLKEDSATGTTKKLNVQRAIMESTDRTSKATPEIAGTKWALLNGFTDYVDHDKTVKPSNDTDKWADSILFGSGAELKRKALAELIVL